MVWNTRPEIRVEASAWIFFSVLILMLPLNWVLAVFMAALIHELCHFAVLRILRVPVFAMRIGGRGAAMETGSMTQFQELLCTLAGPVGSFMLLLLVRIFPRLAICGLIQGIYNLIPLYPMDGGRIARCAIAVLRGKSHCKREKLGVQ